MYSHFIMTKSTPAMKAAMLYLIILHHFYTLLAALCATFCTGTHKLVVHYTLGEDISKNNIRFLNEPYVCS